MNPNRKAHSRNPEPVVANWDKPALITQTSFLNNSLGAFAFNPVIGCGFGCQFCCASESANSQAALKLADCGVKDSEATWGKYQFLKIWDEERFVKSIESAEDRIGMIEKAGAESAVVYSTLTDPYQVIAAPDTPRRGQFSNQLRRMVRRSLELVLENSFLDVRVLTRSPMASRDFDLFKAFGPRLTFGMSVPTLRDDLVKAYEPHAPSVSERLQTLKAAQRKGLNVFVAISPIYPECDEIDLRTTMQTVATLNPVSIFCEAINFREGIGARIVKGGAATNLKNIGIFSSPFTWHNYAITCLATVQRIAQELGILDRIHLMPARQLGDANLIERTGDPAACRAWLDYWRNRQSNWPQRS